MEIELCIRSAEKDDVPFLAWVMLEAAHSGHDIGLWEVMVPDSENEKLQFIEELAQAGTKSLCHYSNFLMAEVNGEPAAALAGYDSSKITRQQFAMALHDVQSKLHWGFKRVEEARCQTSAFLGCFPDFSDNSWIIEWVATKNEFRRMGLMEILLHRMIRIGYESTACDVFQISYAIGNDPAINAYRKLGFNFIDEKRDNNFADKFGYPGIGRMQMTREQVQKEFIDV
ncbi:MAG: GNAT family N-acetyltransferase [Gammaproteobacteria bacterium]|nr:MAG: GNAT family N-acetyltransferase [Gammaproteobacteria bacterium]